jgi:hypothetical protein
MNETELLYMGSAVAQVLIAALGLGAVFYVLIAQRADAKTDEMRLVLENHMSIEKAAIRQSMLLEGDLFSFHTIARKLADENQLTDDQTTRLFFAGSTIWWAGRVKRRTQYSLRAATVFGVPVIIFAIAVTATANLLSHADVVGVIAAATLGIFSTIVLSLTMRLIWVGSAAQISVSISREEDRFVFSAIFSQSRWFLSVHKWLFMEEAGGLTYDRRQAVRRWRKKLAPVWKRAAPRVESVLLLSEMFVVRFKNRIKVAKRRQR